MGQHLQPSASASSEPTLPAHQPFATEMTPRVPVRMSTLGRAFLLFIENQGQAAEPAKYYVQSGAQTAWLTQTGIVFDLIRAKGAGGPVAPDATRYLAQAKHRLRTERPVERERLVFVQDFLDANLSPKIEAQIPQPGFYNFSIGNDPARWHTRVRAYAEVIYRQVWKGIDVRLYGNGPHLEQEFIVQPGADPGAIRVAYRGIEGLRVADDGALVIDTTFGPLHESRPRIYQEIQGERVEVAGWFKLLNATTYTFEFGPYHPQYALLIDPTLSYSTYLGGSSIDEGYGIAVDSSGHAYVVGGTYSLDFPAVPFWQPTFSGISDTFVSKLTPEGSAFVYVTLLGGSAFDIGYSIALDAQGNTYITGETQSDDFPTVNPLQQTFSGISDAFVAKLNPDGSLLYATYLGGSAMDRSFGIAVGDGGYAHVTGHIESPDFPTTAGAFQRVYGGDSDGFVTKLNLDGSALVYSTFLGGSGYEFSFGIAMDSAGDAYVTGETSSSDFPTTAEAFQPVHGGDVDAFVTKLNSTGSALVYSTYLGGSTPNESGSDITVDAFGHAYVTGVADTGFPTTEGAFQPTCSLDAFVTKLSPDGSTLIYSTCLGGSVGDGGSDIAVDAAGHAYVVGGTSSTDFPTVSPLQPPCKDHFAGRFCLDGVVAKLSPTGSALVYSILLGGIREDPINGIALDGASHAYVVGATRSPDFPTSDGAFQPTYQNMDFSTSTDAFVAKIVDAATSADVSITLADSPKSVRAGDILTYTATIVNSSPEAAPAVTLSSNIQTDRGEAIVVSITASQGGCIQDAFEGGYVNVTCRLRDLAAGASATAVMQVRPTSRGSTGNTAVVSSGASDPELATNIASTDTRVNRRRWVK